MYDIYKNIRLLRKQKGWTQEELATRMGYTDRSMIAKIEAGKVDLARSKIFEFAKVFGVSASDLMGDDGVSVPEDTEASMRIRELYSILPPEILDDPKQYAQIKDIVNAYISADADGRSSLVGLLKSLQPKP